MPPEFNLQHYKTKTVYLTIYREGLWAGTSLYYPWAKTKSHCFKEVLGGERSGTNVRPAKIQAFGAWSGQALISHPVDQCQG